MDQKQQWEFKARFRSGAYSWQGSALAVKRLNEAVSEIRKVARFHAVAAADGAVGLFERFWPAFQHIDSSSGALGAGVNRTQQDLLPLIAKARADRETRDKWLDRLWKAAEEDGVEFLSPTEDYWGELCASPETASEWADRLVGMVREAWADRGYLRGTSACLSCLLAAGRHEDLLDLLGAARFPFWHYRKFGVRALLKERRFDDALAYAEASRGLNEPDRAIDAACEEVLIAAGRPDEAYSKYGLGANQAGTGLATFRALRKKYPGVNPEHILHDLAELSGDCGHWFAAAKDAGFLDLALKFATEGHPDPLTLSRASRDLVEQDAEFAMLIGWLAVRRMLEGHGYEVTVAQINEARGYCLVAAGKIGVEDRMRQDFLTLVSTGKSNVRDLLLRHWSI